MLQTETEEARRLLAGDLIQQGIKANVRTLIKIHKWLLGLSAASDCKLSSGDSFASVCLLIEIGLSDSRTGHLYLKSLVNSPPSQKIDADAMEAMAFEERQWEGLYILDKLRSSSCQAVKMSCLYALQYKKVHDLLPELYRDVVLPFLKHEDAWLRVFAIDVVSMDPQAKETLEKLRNSEKEAWVLRAIDDALVMINELEEAHPGKS